MARCASIDVLQQIKLDGEMEEIESSESELEMDAPDSPEIIVLDRKDDDSSSSEESVKEISTGPVLSLRCLHDDSINKSSDSQERIKESADSTSLLKCLLGDSVIKGNNSLNTSEPCTEPRVEFIDINDVPELSINSDQEETEDEAVNNKISEVEEEEEHPHLVPLIGNGSSCSSNDSSCKIITSPRSSVPARNNWEGAHNFKIKIDCGPQAKKGELVIFDETQIKLYITKDYTFKVLISADNVPKDSWIRVSAVFSLAEHSYDTVQRCPTHAQQDFLKGMACYEHFVQCLSDASVYEKTKSGKLSVCTLYKKPQEGETYSTYLFKFTCFSSCSGGINRRPFVLMFILEKDNIPLGRQVIKAKVCACPLRDYKLETGKREQNTSNFESQSNSKESSESSNPQNRTDRLKKTYSIAVKDPELYRFLEQMKTFYETSASCIISNTQ